MTRHDCLRKLLFLCPVLLFSQAVLAGSLVPVDVSDFYIVPDKNATLTWNASDDSLPKQLDYAVFDVGGNKIAEHKAVNHGKTVTAAVTFPPGYWEIAFEQTGDRFGVVSLPAAQKPFDKFFAIDGALSWLVNGDDLREGIIKSAKRSGIGMVRERLKLREVASAEGKFDWDTHRHYDLIRQTYKRHGIEVLELGHDAPAWMGGLTKVYPKNLNQYAQAWRKITEKWQDTWAGIEVWNEPDIFFGGDLPADQCVPLAKAMAYSYQQDGCKVPIIGGVMAVFNKAWLDSAAKNGMLDVIDIFSFHTYDHAPRMEKIAAGYRYWLRDCGYENMPLWLTECGRPWKKGPDRPPVEQDLESVTDIVMKGIESKCCGIDRYFPFVLPYFEENDNNFGMLDRQGTPLRSMAGYAQMIHLLAHSEYIGDLKPEACSLTDENTPQLVRARVFRTNQDQNGSKNVVVLYTGNMKPTELKTTFKTNKAESVTGEVLPSSPLKITNGLVYLLADVPENLIDTNTEAAKLLAFTKTPFRRSDARISPLVPVYDCTDVEANSAGYRVQLREGTGFSIPITVHDLSDGRHYDTTSFFVERKTAPENIIEKTRPELTKSFGLIWLKDHPKFSSSIEGVEEITGEYDFTLREDEDCSTKLSLRFFSEPTFTGLLENFPNHMQIDISPEKWTSGSSGTLNLEPTDKDGVLMKCRFGEGDKWCYPRLAIPGGISLVDYQGFILRYRGSQDVVTRQFLFERDSGAGYITNGTTVSADGQWHAIRIPFDQLFHSPSTAPDPDGKLDLEEVDSLSIGFNTKSEEATLEIGDLYLYRTD